MRYKVRHFATLGLLLLLPVLTLGLSPILTDVLARLDTLEEQAQTIAENTARLAAAEAESAILQQQLDSVQAESDGELVVIDVNGVQIGTGSVLSGGCMEMPFDLDGLPPFVLRASKDGVKGTANRILFESNDCSGQPWIVTYL